MRIISGKFKGKRINPPQNITARPTTDFAKESLFNLLNNRIDIEDADVLDLFSGTGSISLECVSRGAREVIGIELAQRQADFIRKTIAQLNITNYRLLRTADPPYDLPTLPTLPQIIFEKGLLKTDGIFVLEHPAKYDFSEHPHFCDHRNYGSVNFTFFK